MSEESPDLTHEPVPYALLTFADEAAKVQAMRLWVFEMVHGREETKLNQDTILYCQRAFDWIVSGLPANNGAVVPFPAKRPTLHVVGPDETG